MLKRISLIFLGLSVFIVLGLVTTTKVKAQCACDCICVQGGNEVGACDCENPSCESGSPSLTNWGPNCHSGATPPPGGGVRRGECNGRAVDCAPGYIRTDTVLNVECKSDYGGVGAWCGQPGTAQAVTGCCSTMIPDREYGGEICRYGDDRITTYACAPTCDPNAWGSWSACSASCGGGTQTRTNACGSVQGQVCNTQSCQGPWWQVKDSDVSSNGDLTTNILGGKYFDLAGGGLFPGIPSASGTTDLDGSVEAHSPMVITGTNMTEQRAVWT